jgi:phosphohistidine swiveling domain-containing protein
MDKGHKPITTRQQRYLVGSVTERARVTEKNQHLSQHSEISQILILAKTHSSFLQTSFKHNAMIVFKTGRDNQALI